MSATAISSLTVSALFAKYRWKLYVNGKFICYTLNCVALNANDVSYIPPGNTTYDPR